MDLLKTDYFHAAAYPTYLYYNPHTLAKTVEIDVGPDAKDLYDAVSDKILKRNARGLSRFTIPADTARIIVLAPAGGKMTRQAKRILIDNVVVRYTN